jgi:hypothetical protein
MENKFKERNEEKPQERASKEKKLATSFFKKMDFSDFLSKENAVALMPYFIFLALLGIVYISNTYYAERTIRKIDKITNELKELRSEYITSKSDLMFKSKQSEVARAVESMGLLESVTPPKIILIKKDTIK